MDLRSLLHSLTNRILDAKENAYGELFGAADELYKFLLQVTGTDAEEYTNKKKVRLDSGHAIGLTWAAMSIKDFRRTKKFIDGIYEAVTDTIKKNSSRPIHILYAGTGPFATLVLPLIARFSSKQLQFTLLEVNENSFHCLQRLIATLQLEPYMRQMEKTDATLWEIDPKDPVDIFICETMNTGLTKEPQVAIFMNIVPQLDAKAIIIPGKIRLQAALIDPVKRMKHKWGNDKDSSAVYVLGDIFELSRENTIQYATAFKKAGKNYKFPGTTVIIPSEKAMTHSQFCVLTHISVHNTIQLLTDESPLTMPLKLLEVVDPSPVRIKCHYEAGENPGIRFSI
jgi:predicted RNA methylase